MDKRKLKKWGIILCVLFVLGVIGTISQSDESEVETNTTAAEENTAEKSKKPSMTTDELMEYFDTYEKLYVNHLEGISKVAEKNDNLELQKTLANTRDISNAAHSKIFDIKSGFDSSSNEYKALDELSVAFNSLESACKNGIKYIDKNEYKYYEKYENDLKQSDLFLQRYMEAKNNIK
ncbi:hypothetical protein C672_1737 [[Clostridium] bifermentans ATCC 638]|uniref:Uncharacterized protein n=1 Tax=Paraclostridium bifermentans ATCC 638 = DSM 14991 TaxID=1233171 RepID=T4VMS6_PARBF|nr:hypothetical protein [Paraclostridium bifermentans]EQK42793.1 hypothetical protein C672_1737 [[Clostridium] bifermentans ATCC 638] [Paraclostridium bifermentans ATCC 638 = DSM 14991]RIZ58468.1 hypothetical protein CHH45_11635 [Paraclostridium bifermentans]UAG19588.1 hypothetical protein KXZ80_07730 [Paraclostridium bifermentans]